MSSNHRISQRKTVLIVPEKTPLLPVRAPIRTRDDLPFTERDREGRLNNWAVPHEFDGCWHRGVRIGYAFFEAVAELARHNPQEAIEALQYAPNTPTWRSNGWGIECGFSEMVARAAIKGLLEVERP